MGAQIVKWLGNNIKDDTNHRLVTDNMIEKWNKVDNVQFDQWIELTPENISQYTTTKAAGDWEDLGFEEIFDSDSLPEGNYIIKLGMDKLIPMDSVAAPEYSTLLDNGLILIKAMLSPYDDSDFSTIDPITFCEKYEISDLEFQMACDNADVDPNNINESEYEIVNMNCAIIKMITNLCYLNYAIEPTTFIFLCQFFNTDFSLYNLLNVFSVLNIPCKLSCNYFLFNPSSDFDNILSLEENRQDNIICFPEYICIKITKNVLDAKTIDGTNKEIYAKLNNYRYEHAYNYKIEKINIDDNEKYICVPTDECHDWSPYHFDFFTKSYLLTNCTFEDIYNLALDDYPDEDAYQNILNYINKIKSDDLLTIGNGIRIYYPTSTDNFRCPNYLNLSPTLIDMVGYDSDGEEDHYEQFCINFDDSYSNPVFSYKSTKPRYYDSFLILQQKNINCII